MEPIGLVTWYLVKLLMWMGGTGFVAMLGVLAVLVFCVGHVVGGLKERKEKLMSHAKLDHIKYDILPDGTLGPGDNRNLEGPE